MAVSNRDRVGQAFELLAAGLGPFVDQRVTAVGGNAGGDWLRLLEARDEAKNGVKKRSGW